MFRPSGHGALLSNLNEIDADIVFIKNIDNVVVYKYKEEVATYKKVLAGILLELQNRIFKYLNQLDSEKVSESLIDEIPQFMYAEINVKLIRDD